MSSLDLVDFGLKIFRHLSTESNSVFSPQSLTTCLTMVLMGTRNASAEQLSKALFNKTIKDDHQLESVAKELGQTIDKCLKSNSKSMSSANFLYTDSQFQVLKQFVDLVHKYFNTNAKQLDFQNKMSESIDVINKDISIATNGKIDKLLESLDESTAIVLANALYFKGLWKSQFQKENTVSDKFTTNSKQEIDVQMMFQSRKYPFAYCPRLKTKAVELNYENSTAVMVLLLPDPDHSLSQLRQNLDIASLNQLVQSLQSVKVDLSLPKFKIDSTFDLIEPLIANGIQHIFNVKSADFSGLSQQKNLFVSKVVQKAVIEVTEEGTEAAAATAVGMMLMSLNPDIHEFKANRPFIYFVVTKKEDQTIDSILFMGECYKPEI